MFIQHKRSSYLACWMKLGIVVRDRYFVVAETDVGIHSFCQTLKHSHAILVAGQVTICWTLYILQIFVLTSYQRWAWVLRLHRIPSDRSPCFVKCLIWNSAGMPHAPTYLLPFFTRHLQLADKVIPKSGQTIGWETVHIPACPVSTSIIWVAQNFWECSSDQSVHDILTAFWLRYWEAGAAILIENSYTRTKHHSTHLDLFLPPSFCTSSQMNRA